MPEYKPRNTFIAIVLVIIGVVLTGISQNWFGPQKVQVKEPVKVEVINPVHIIPDSTHYKTPGNLTTDTPNNGMKENLNEKNLPNTTSKTPVAPSDLNGETKQMESKRMVSVVNKSAKARFAVLAVTNGRKDNQLATVGTNWLRQRGSASYSVLLNSFIELGFFDKILDGDSYSVTNTDTQEAADYICLIKCTLLFENDKTYSSLIIAKSSYEMILVETKSGKVIDEFTKPMEKCPGISQESAKQVAEDSLYKFLERRHFAL